MKRAYLKLHLWLKARCERLSIAQRRWILYSISLVYLFSSLLMIASLFLSGNGKKRDLSAEEGKRKLVLRELVDSPLPCDTLIEKKSIQEHTT